MSAVTMDDMFDVEGDVTFDDDDSMLDFEPGLEPQMRSRAYTWPTRPPDSTLLGDRPNFSPGTAGGEMTAVMAVEDGMRLQPGDSRGDAPLSPDGSSASRKVSSRRNAWGSMSYADLITKAIESSPEKRLTLSQIYAWMVANVPFFHDKGDSNSSAGWKNSIRHNLSLHSRFMRVQNEGTGKSSWWMVNTDTVSKMPRKRAGTMDATSGYRRPTKPGKRLPGVLKHARSTELHGGGIGEDLSEPGLSSVPVLGDPISFGSPRMRASSGNSSNSGCSPAALGTPQESEGGPCFTIPPSWDVFPKHETLSESLADIFISDAAYNVPAVGTTGQPSPLYVAIQQPQSQAVFVTNEAYAHGVPIHQPSPQQHATAQQPNILLQQQEQSFARFSAPPSSTTVPFQSSVHNVPVGGGMGVMPQTSSDRVPTLGELLQDQRPGAGYLLHSYLTSGGSVSTQTVGPSWANSSPGSEIPLQSPAAAGQTGSGNPAGVPSARRPFPINQKLLMQLLVTKPHLATRLQQLIEAKRRQLTAMQQGQNSSAATLQQQNLPQQQQRHSASSLPEAAGHNAHSTMLQQLLTAVPATNQSASSNTTPPSSSGSIDNELFPPDLDLSLLDQYSTSDINCDIEQVIQHELSFGDKLDFSFDQLHLDEFGADFAN